MKKRYDTHYDDEGTYYDDYGDVRGGGEFTDMDYVDHGAAEDSRYYDDRSERDSRYYDDRSAGDSRYYDDRAAGGSRYYDDDRDTGDSRYYYDGDTRYGSDARYDDDFLYNDDNPYEDEEYREESYRRERSSKRSGRRRRRINRVEILILAVLAAVLVVSVYMVVSQLLVYRQAAQEYEELSSLFEAIPESDAEDTDVSGEGDTEETLSYPALTIDYEELKNINDEFVCIIHIPVLDLTYPVAQAQNNSDYLTTTFEGTANSSGCIFLDYLASPDFSDWNTFIFGHNMKNQTMFGSLQLFMQDEELCDENPYIYLYLEEQVLIYRIVAYYTIPVEDDVYNDFYSEEGYDAYVADALLNSLYAGFDESEIDWSQRPNLLTLSTCYATGHVRNFVVQAALVGTVSL